MIDPAQVKEYHDFFMAMASLCGALWILAPTVLTFVSQFTLRDVPKPMLLFAVFALATSIDFFAGMTLSLFALLPNLHAIDDIKTWPLGALYFMAAAMILCAILWLVAVFKVDDRHIWRPGAFMMVVPPVLIVLANVFRNGTQALAGVTILPGAAASQVFAALLGGITDILTVGALIVVFGAIKKN